MAAAPPPKTPGQIAAEAAAEVRANQQRAAEEMERGRRGETTPGSITGPGRDGNPSGEENQGGTQQTPRDRPGEDGPQTTGTDEDAPNDEAPNASEDGLRAPGYAKALRRLEARHDAEMRPFYKQCDLLTEKASVAAVASMGSGSPSSYTANDAINGCLDLTKNIREKQNRERDALERQYPARSLAELIAEAGGGKQPKPGSVILSGGSGPMDAQGKIFARLEQLGQLAIKLKLESLRDPSNAEKRQAAERAEARYQEYRNLNKADLQDFEVDELTHRLLNEYRDALGKEYLELVKRFMRFEKAHLADPDNEQAEKYYLDARQRLDEFKIDTQNDLSTERMRAAEAEAAGGLQKEADKTYEDLARRSLALRRAMLLDPNNPEKRELYELAAREFNRYKEQNPDVEASLTGLTDRIAGDHNQAMLDDVRAQIVRLQTLREELRKNPDSAEAKAKVAEARAALNAIYERNDGDFERAAGDRLRAEEENTYKAMIAANLEREQRAVNDLRFAAATDAVDDEKRSAAEHAQDRLDELKERAEADLRSENPNLSPDAVREMTSREQAQYRTRLNDEYRERATAEINLRIRTHKNPNNQDDRQAYERSRSARESMYDAVSDELDIDLVYEMRERLETAGGAPSPKDP